MSNPLISIIIPNYNRADLIGETLDSVLAQTYTKWECIIVDDGSTDNSKEIIEIYVEKDRRFQLHNRPSDRPKGANACRNYGFELSKGEYINWFDSDDLMHPNKLKTQIEALHDSVINFSVCQTLIFEKKIDNILGLRHDSIYSNKPFEDFIKQKIIWLTQAPLFKRSFLTKNGLYFDESLQAAQEYEFFCRVLYYSPNYHYTDKAYVFFRKHENGISFNEKSRTKRRLNNFLAREKIFDFLNHRDEFNEYLDVYVASTYFYYIRKGKYKKALNTLNKRILKISRFNLKYKFNMLLALLTFSIVKKGGFLLIEKKYKEK